MKEIYCDICTIYLGSLETGSKIRKGTSHLCEDCMTKLTVQSCKTKTTYSQTEEMFSGFGDLFGDIFKGKK